MMTRSPEKQCRLLAVTMEELIPENHFLRKLDAAISFDFVYDIVAPLYSAQGRPSIDPVILVKMLLLGYLYGIDSERKLAEEVRYNIAYRWYLGFDLDDAPPRSLHIFSKSSPSVQRTRGIPADLRPDRCKVPGGRTGQGGVRRDGLHAYQGQCGYP